MRDYVQEGRAGTADPVAGTDLPMRAMLFAHRLSQRNPTGISRYLRELVCALAQVTAERTELIVGSTKEPEAPAWVPSSVKRRIVPWPRRGVQLAWCLGSGPVLERSLGKLDLVHLIQPFPPVRSKAPQLVTVHDLFPLQHPTWYRRSEQWTYRRSMKLALQRAARIVVPSEYVARGLEEALGVARSRVAAIPLGVSGMFGRDQSTEQISESCSRLGVEPGRYAVCVGQVSARKNLVPVIRAFAQVPAADRIPLVLIGPDGHGVEEVDAEISRLRASEAAIRRTGFVSDQEAAALVAGATVLVHPALGEGFGFVPLEAMAAGTPVIAAAASSIPEITGSAALLVQAPSEPDAWAGALLALLSDPQRRTELIAAGEQRVAEFTWRRSAAMLLDIYDDVAGS